MTVGGEDRPDDPLVALRLHRAERRGARPAGGRRARGGAGRGGATARSGESRLRGRRQPEQRRADGQRQPHAARHRAPHPLHPGPPERGRVARHHGEVPQRPAGDGRGEPPRHPDRVQHRPAPRRGPRRSRRRGAGAPAAPARPTISQWPDQLGLAVARDPEQVRKFGQIAAKELRAIGIQCLLGPMADTHHRAALEPDQRHVRRGPDPGHVAHQGDRRGLPGQAARARERDDGHQALPRRRPGEGRLRRPQRLRQVVHLPRQPVRPPPAVPSRPRSRPAPAAS